MATSDKTKAALAAAGATSGVGAVDANPQLAPTAKAPKAKTEYILVTMDDGRKVEFPSKRRLQKSIENDKNGKPAVRLDFSNGETRIFSLPEGDMLIRLAIHGAMQKLGDELAGVEVLDDGIQAIDELAARLQSGKWSEETSGKSAAGSSVLQKALVEVSGKTAEEIRSFLAGKTAAEKAAIRTNPKILVVVQRLEAERANKAAAKSTNSDELLAGLGV